MCDGERMSVESCPGGTVWDHLNKACVWPDMQGVVTLSLAEQQRQILPSRSLPVSTGYGQYSQQPQIPLLEKPKIHHRVIPSTVQGYGSSLPVQGYGSSLPVQQPLPQRDIQIQQPTTLPQQPIEFQKPQTFVGQQSMELPKTNSYGSQLPVQQQWPQPVQQQWPQPKPQVWQPTQRLQDVRPIPQQSGY